MIPEFPVFAPIHISQKDTVEALLSRYEPYSDFNFASLLCWNIDGTTEISLLNGNLIIKLPHYINGKTCYSLLGRQEIDKSIDRLLQSLGKLDFVPEIVVNSMNNPERFEIAEDPDHFDYIYSLEEHTILPGKKYSSKRKMISKFSRAYDHAVAVRIIDFSNPDQVRQLERTFVSWAQGKTKNQEEALAESKAINRLVEYAAMLNIIGFELMANDKVLGFSIVEIVHEGYAIFHFHKTHTTEPGSDAYLTNQVSHYLHQQGCTLINWEQDLGIEGLRYSKMGYKPVKMLKKYQISRPQT